MDKLLNQKEHFVEMFKGGAIASIKYSSDLKIIYANDKFYKVFSITREEFAEKYDNSLGHVIDNKDLKLLKILLANNIEYNLSDIEFEFKLKSGDKDRWLCLNGCIERDDNDSIELSCLFMDITGAKASIVNYEKENEKLLLDIQRDTMTNLYNKKYAKKLIDEYISDEGMFSKHVFMVLDIDDFKKINDTRGHLFGDEVLSNVAAYFNRTFRESDVTCRAGGDEFIIFLKNYTSTDAIIKITNKLMDIFQNNKMGINKDYDVTCSVGVSTYPDDGKDFNRLFMKADKALYEAKSKGKNRLEFCNDELNARVNNERTQSEICEGINKNEFKVYLQPKLNMHTKTVESAKALVRWVKNGIVQKPCDFVPDLEKRGFMEEIDFYVYDKVFEFMDRHRNEDNSNMKYSINVSKAHLENRGFMLRLNNLISKYNVDTARVEFEFKADILVNNNKIVYDFIKGLSDIGFNIVVDNFAYSCDTLELIKRLPIDVIKLDRNIFVDGKVVDGAELVAKTVMMFARRHGIKVMAEKIESMEQLSFAQEIGCDMVLGNLIGEPVRSEEFFNIYDSDSIYITMDR